MANQWQKPPKYLRKGYIYNEKRYFGRVFSFKYNIITSMMFIEMLGPVKSNKLDLNNNLFINLNIKQKGVSCTGKPKHGNLMYVWTWDEIINDEVFNRAHIKIIK